jgi:hypothetical protein
MDTEDPRNRPDGDDDVKTTDIGDDVIDLVDVVDEERPPTRMPDEEEIRRYVVEAAERIARDMFPSIAERIIREEIDKLKRDV